MPSGPVSAVSAVVADRLLRRAAARLPLRLVYPDGTVIGAADPTAPALVVHRPDALARRIGRYGLIGFGESYMAGEWSSKDLTQVLTVFANSVADLVPGTPAMAAADRPGLPAPLAKRQPPIRPGATSPSTTTCRTTCSPSSSTKQ